MVEKTESAFQINPRELHQKGIQRLMEAVETFSPQTEPIINQGADTLTPERRLRIKERLMAEIEITQQK